MIKGCNYEFMNKMGSYYKLTNPNGKVDFFLYKTNDLFFEHPPTYTTYQLATTFNGSNYLVKSVSSESVVEMLLTGWTSERVVPNF